MTLNDLLERLNYLARDVDGETEIESIRPLGGMIEIRFANGVISQISTQASMWKIKN